MMRLARAFDRRSDKDFESPFGRIATAISKYWVCKRASAVAYEALECLGRGVDPAPHLSRGSAQLDLGGLRQRQLPGRLPRHRQGAGSAARAEAGAGWGQGRRSEIRRFRCESGQGPRPGSGRSRGSRGPRARPGRADGFGAPRLARSVVPVSISGKNHRATGEGAAEFRGTATKSLPEFRGAQIPPRNSRVVRPSVFTSVFRGRSVI
jgi:hypothetical protein